MPGAGLMVNYGVRHAARELRAPAGQAVAEYLHRHGLTGT